MPPGLRATIDVLEAHGVMWLEHRTADGSALALRALELVRVLADQAGDPSAIDEDARRAYLDALELDLEAAMQRADLSAIVSLADELAPIARGFDESSHARSVIFAGVGLRWQGRIVEAAGRFRQAWNDGRRRVLPGVAIEAGHWLAYTLLDMGDFAEAERVARESHELRVRVGDLARIRSRTRTVRHEVEFARGSERAALSMLLADVERGTGPSLPDRVPRSRRCLVGRTPRTGCSRRGRPSYRDRAPRRGSSRLPSLPARVRYRLH